MNGVLILAFLWILKAFLEVISIESKERFFFVVKRIELWNTLCVIPSSYHVLDALVTPCRLFCCPLIVISSLPDSLTLAEFCIYHKFE